jgi:hypothetical protein
MPPKESQAMLPSDSAETLRRFLSDRGIDAKLAPLEQILPVFLEFYATVPASDLDPTADSDMLLFQYGVYDWGNGAFFEVDITRQFIMDGLEGDDAISQLHCTTLFEPVAELRAIEPSNRWCWSHSELGEFKQFILASTGYRAVLRAEAARREISWEGV